MCRDSDGPLGPYGPLSAGLRLSQLAGSVSIVAYLMSWWTLPPADTGKWQNNTPPNPLHLSVQAASQSVCPERHQQSSLALSIYLLLSNTCYFTFSHLTYLLSIPVVIQSFMCISFFTLSLVHLSHGMFVPLFSLNCEPELRSLVSLSLTSMTHQRPLKNTRPRREATIPVLLS